jgi:hypothetical protein
VSTVPLIKGVTPELVDRALEEHRGDAQAFLAIVREYALPLDELEAEGVPTPILFVIDNVEDASGWFIALLSTANSHQQFSDLIDVLTPSENVPASATVEQARRNAEARSTFLAEFPTLSSSEVADLVGSRSRNRAALAHGWRKQGRIFSIAVGRQQRYPLFQFDMEAGEPKPVIAKVIALLRRAGVEGWQIALWFTGALSRLDDRRPIDVLDVEPERVVDAAGSVQDIPY